MAISPASGFAPSAFNSSLRGRLSDSNVWGVSPYRFTGGWIVLRSMSTANSAQAGLPPTKTGKKKARLSNVFEFFVSIFHFLVIAVLLIARPVVVVGDFGPILRPYRSQ